MKRFYQNICKCIALLTLFHPVKAAAQQAAKPRGNADGFTVDINTPNFRKMVIAITEITPVSATDAADPGVQAFVGKAKDYLPYLMNYSGLYRLIGQGAFADFFKPVANGDLAESALKVQAQWKAIGVETVVMGQVTKEKDGLTLQVIAWDVLKGKSIVDRKFTAIKADDTVAILRRIGDLILENYTGKSGIFNSKIAFIGKNAKGAAKQLFVADFDGSNPIQLTQGRGPQLSPSWSPDGKFITFTSFDNGNADVYRIEVATRKISRIAGSSGLDSGSNWSPNGQLVAFTSSTGPDTDVYTVSPDGRDRKLIIQGQGLDVDPAFSPDGKWLAYVSGRYGNPHIFRAELQWNGTGTAKVVADKRLTYQGWYNARPAWHPTGEKIAFAGYDRDIDRFDIFLMEMDGSKIERLTLRAGDNEHPTWSPNGYKLMFQSSRVGRSDSKGNNQLWTMDRDGDSQSQLALQLYSSEAPAWSQNVFGLAGK
jgi:TolB protein